MTRIAHIVAALDQTIEVLRKKYGYGRELMESIAFTGRANITHLELFVEWVLRNMGNGPIPLLEDSGASMRWPEDRNRALGAFIAWENVGHPEGYNRDQWRQVANELFPGRNIKNVLAFTLHDLEEIVDGVEDFDINQQAQRIEDKQPPGTEMIYNDGTYQFIKIPKLPGKLPRGFTLRKSESRDAVCHYSRGTKWCTSDPEVTSGYLAEGDFYVLFMNGKKFAQFHPASNQLMDLRDRDLDMRQYPGLLQAFEKSGLAEEIMKQSVEDPRIPFLFMESYVRGPWPWLRDYGKIYTDDKTWLAYYNAHVPREARTI